MKSSKGTLSNKSFKVAITTSIPYLEHVADSERAMSFKQPVCKAPLLMIIGNGKSLFKRSTKKKTRKENHMLFNKELRKRRLLRENVSGKCDFLVYSVFHNFVLISMLFALLNMGEIRQ